MDTAFKHVENGCDAIKPYPILVIYGKQNDLSPGLNQEIAIETAGPIL